MPARIGARRIEGGGVLRETALLVAAMTTPPTLARKKQINTLIGSLVASGAWPLLDVLYVTAAADSQAARLNWKNPGTLTLTPVNSPTFTADRGYAGDGSTSYLRTGLNPTAAGLQYTLNSAHYGFWCVTNAAISSSVLGMARISGTTNQIFLNPRNGGGSAVYGINQDLAGSTYAVADCSGHWCIQRTASNAIAAYQRGLSTSTAASVSTAIPNLELYVGGLNDNGSPSSFTTRQIAASHIGAALTDAQVLALSNALTSYMTAVGAYP